MTAVMPCSAIVIRRCVVHCPVACHTQSTYAIHVTAAVCIAGSRCVVCRPVTGYAQNAHTVHITAAICITYRRGILNNRSMPSTVMCKCYIGRTSFPVSYIIRSDGGNPFTLFTKYFLNPANIDMGTVQSPSHNPII